MKKAVKFKDWCYNTLSEEEVKMLNDATDTICGNHENGKLEISQNARR